MEITLSKFKTDKPSSRSIIVAETSYDDFGIGIGGTKRGQIPIDPKKAPMGAEAEQKFLKEFQARYDVVLTDTETNSVGWYEVAVMPKGEQQEASVAADETEQEA